MGKVQSKIKHYYCNRKMKKILKKNPAPKQKKHSNYRNTYFKKYPFNSDAVKVRYYRNGIEVFDVKPQYSYIYKGVPGGWVY